MESDPPGKTLFSQRIKQERLARGWSQSRLAELLDIDAKTISRWELGQALPASYLREKLRDILGTNLKEMGLIDHEQPVVAPLFDSAIPLHPAFDLVGRDKPLTHFKQRLLNGGNLALSALNGLPGVGKTALAIALAHDRELRAHFKDGILWAGLGPSPNIMAHLSRWGTLLGFSNNEMSKLQSIESWSLAIHRAIASRSMLLIIDDAWKPEDALAFKVGGRACGHLLTTRFPPLAQQLAVEGVTILGELSIDDGLELLRKLAPRVVAMEAAQARELVEAVGGLPLALILIGNYLRTQAYSGSHRRIAMALHHLLNASIRLDLQEARAPADHHSSLPGDSRISLRSVISVTDQHLSATTRTVLYALAVFPAKPNNFSEEAALTVANCPVEVLDYLTDTGLIQSSSADRYTLHQTIADYAGLQFRNLNDPSAYQRLIAYFTAFVETHRKNYELLEIESNNILAALDAAVKQSYGAELVRLAVAFAPFLLARGLYPIASTCLQDAYHAALEASNDLGLAGVLLHLGEMTWKRGDLKQAELYLQEGLTHAQMIDDQAYICAILAPLGSVTWKQGDYGQAERYLQEGLSLAHELQDIENLCRILDILGSVEMRQGHYVRAQAYLQEGLILGRQMSDREQTCTMLLNLGVIAGEQGNLTQAKTYFMEGLMFARQLGHNEWISGLLNNLGEVAAEQGHFDRAEVYLQEGLTLARQIGHREWTSLLLANLGLLARKQARYPSAEQYMQESLTLARQIGIPQITCLVLYGYGNLHLAQQHADQAKSNFEEMLNTAPEGGQDLVALAHYGLARAAHADGKLEEAKHLGKRSLSTLEHMGRGEAREVKSWLDSLPAPSDE